MVYAFPSKTTPREPAYTFSVIDELKNEYEAAKAYAGSAVVAVDLLAASSLGPVEELTALDLAYAPPFSPVWDPSWRPHAKPPRPSATPAEGPAAD